MSGSEGHQIRVEPGSEHVRVEIGGVTVADSGSPRLLYETGLPVRYYLPPEDVRFDLLEPSDTVTHCPFKGDAGYWSMRADGTTHQDVAWYYPAPIQQRTDITGLVCFYPGKVDLYVDGVKAG